MGFFEEMFDPVYLFDSGHKQRRDIEKLRSAVVDSFDAQTPADVARLMTRVDQMQLMVNALVEIIERKGLATREELTVMVQQIDLLDGVEDGKMRQVWSDAPRCGSCNNYVNPEREVCVYCQTPIRRMEAGGAPYRGGAPPSAPEPRLATCAMCGERVPQAQTYFTGDGELVCSRCNQGG